MSNLDCIKRDIEALGTMSDSKVGTTRLSYFPSYRNGIEYLKKKMQGAGLVDIHEDGIGTRYGTLEESDQSAPPIMTGSHLDSVACGGNFGGAGGIICSLEAIGMLVENKVSLRSPVVLTVTCMEEGARWDVGSSPNMT